MALIGNEQNNATEIMSKSLAGAESTLGELLGKPVSIETVQVDSVDSSSIGSIMPGNNLVAPVELSDGEGHAVLIISEAQAAIMADLMIGQDGSNPPTSLEDLHLSAVTELTNQALDSIVSSVASQTAKTLLTTPLEVSVVDLGAGVIPGVDGDVIILEGNLKIGDFEPGKIAVVISGGAAEAVKSGAQAEVSLDGFVTDTTAGASTVKKSAPSAQNIVASELSSQPSSGRVYDRSLDIVMDVPLQVTVELGRTQKLVRDVLEMSPGSVIELDKLAGEPVDILVNQKYIAKGEVVVIDENFGIRITDIIRPADRIPKI